MQLSYIFATVATLFFASANAVEDCDATELAKLAPLATSSNLAPCQEASDGWQLLPPSGTPTEAQLKAMCQSEACVGLFKELSDLNPSDCKLTVSGNSIVIQDVITDFKKVCPAAN